MAIKTTGAEFKRFYRDDTIWMCNGVENMYIDDDTILVNGLEYDADYEAIPDDAVVKIICGVVYGPQFERGYEPSLETYFRRWKKKQTTTAFVVECDIANSDAVMAVVKAAGGRVL